MEPAQSSLGVLSSRSKDNKSSVEEETKSTEHNGISRECHTLDSPSDSFFGSVDEELAATIRKIPFFNKTPATRIPQPFPEEANSQLFASVRANDPESCKKLLDISTSTQSSARVNYKGAGAFSALHIASAEGFLKVCEVLLDYGQGTDINTRNAASQTPLHLACLHGHMPVAQLLIRSGAQVNPLDSANNSPLHILASGGDSEFLAWFLAKDPELWTQNDEGRTALELVRSSEMKEMLIEHARRTGHPGLGEVLVGDVGKINPLDFEPVSLLGRGSFGEVYLVRKASGELYAMKVLKKDKIMRHNLVRYAMTERNVLSYIKHPFIVSLNYAFQTADKLFLILDFCPGKDLAHHLAREKRFTEDRARSYLCEILLALEELHSRDIIFRDLKPENIVLNSAGHAMLTDFGLSKEGVYENNAARSFCGSVAYLAPEMIKRKGHGKTVDWYLLGVLLYEMLVGVPPYFSKNKEELLHSIQRGKLRVPKSLSEEAKELLKELLRRDPSTRLGAKRGAEELKEHRFFRGVHWESVLRQEGAVCKPQIDLLPRSSIDPLLVYGDLHEAVTDDIKVSGWTFISN